MPEPATATSAPGTVRRTLIALSVVARRTDTALIVVLAALAYLVIFLVGIGDLSLGWPSGPITVRMADDLSRAFVKLGSFQYAPIVLVSTGGLTYLFSPLNVLIAGVIAGLVGTNLGLAYLAYRQPTACGLESSTAALAGVPALFSGAACCGPTILIALGVQATATVTTVISVLIPLSAGLLVLGLLAVGRRVDVSRL